jgi:hypothetical protein
MLYSAILCYANFSALKMEATPSSETSVLTKPRGRHIPEDDILHIHRCQKTSIPTECSAFKYSLPNVANKHCRTVLDACSITDLFARLITFGDQQSSMTGVSCKPGMFVQKPRLNFVCNSSREFNTIPLVLSGMKHAWVDSNTWLARPSVALSQGHHVY